MSTQIRKLQMAAVSGFLALAMGSTATASEAPKAPGGTDTSVMLHFPGEIRDSINQQVAAKFAESSGKTIHSEYQRSGGFSKAINASIAEGELGFNLVVTYGRTGETPPGRDIFKHMNNARELFETLPGHLEMAPEFAALADTGDGQLMVPYIGLMAITFNPELIDAADVPQSWADLARFEGTLAVPGRGCFAMRTLASLYDVVGAKDLKTL